MQHSEGWRGKVCKSMKYKEWLQRWLYTLKPTLKKTTYARYADAVYVHIVPKLGEIELNKLTDAVLAGFSANLTASHATSTYLGIFGVVNRSLQSASAHGLPVACKPIKRPAKRKNARKIKILSKPNQKRLENYITQSKLYKLYGIVISLYTGLRIGELLALEWGDVDLKAATLTVSKGCSDSYTNGKYKKWIDTPKTESSKREIPLPKQLLPYLRELKAQSKSKYVVEGKNGKELSIRSYQNTFRIVLKRLNLPEAGFHSLRHTFATRALECGMDIKTLSELLGHSNPSVTLKYYSHCLPEHKREMMNKFGRYLQQRA